jgi:hypothetical protein
MPQANKKPSTPQKDISEVDRMRAETGWARFQKALVPEINRITNPTGGRVLSLLYVKAAGRVVPARKPVMDTTEPLSPEQIAEICYLDLRTVQRELDKMVERNIIEQTQVKKGRYEFRLLWDTWRQVKDYAPDPLIALPKPEPDDEDEPPAEDPAAPSGVRTVITSKPVRCSPGKPSKPVKVECGISSLQFLDDIDSEFSAVVEPGGTLLVSRRSWKHSDGVRGLKQAKDLDSVPRQGCRGNEPKGGRRNSETQQSKAGGRRENSRGSVTPAVQHPRADELSALFDPILLEHCHKSLSGDTIALRAACEAIGDTDPQFLIDCVTERGKRKLLVTHILPLCREIAHNWKKAKTLPQTDRIPTRAEIMAMAEADRRALAQKKAVARGKGV